jgi:Putative peptidoglycan binding domain
MDKKCPFDSTTMQFRGNPLQQAQCLLRFPKQFGHVDDAIATIPAKLTNILSNPDTIGFTKEMLRKALAKRGVLEANIGGSLDKPVSRANNNDPTKSLANYFVIHDTSGELSNAENFDSDFINTNKWTGNHLTRLPRETTHVYITRDGLTKTDRDYQTPWRATQFENPDIHKGRFLHHEMTQPRKFSNGYHSLAPDQGFTTLQYELLALCYCAASLRRGRWLIPAFHCVLDLEIPDAHDDPQHFDLVMWDNAIATILGEFSNSPNPILLRSNLFKNDPVLKQVANGGLVLVATGGVVAGIGAVQDALNFLASSQSRPDFAIDLGGNRGSFGPKTKKAIIAFQKQQNLSQTGNIDSVTLLALDGLLP